MKIQAILAAGGLGTRLQAMRPKSLVLLEGKPLFLHSLKVLEESPSIDGIIVVMPEFCVREAGDMIRQDGFKKVVKVVAGGRTRCESVRHGLQAVNARAGVVVVHDGARPLIRPRTLEAAVMEGKRHEAVVVGVPVKPTIKRVNLQGMFVEETLNREELWEIQTPQVFKRSVLQEAHARKAEAWPAAGRRQGVSGGAAQPRSSTGSGISAPQDAPCDDAVLVERLGVRVKVVCGDYDNIKITTQEDLMIAEAFLKSRIREELKANREGVVQWPRRPPKWEYKPYQGYFPNFVKKTRGKGA